MDVIVIHKKQNGRATRFNVRELALTTRVKTNVAFFQDPA
jgi:hypothetical protein